MSVSHCSTISMECMILLYAIMVEKFIDVGKTIYKEIQECATKWAGYAPFPSLITLLSLQAFILPKVDFKERNHQGHITESDVTRIVGDITRQKQPVDEPSEAKSPDHPLSRNQILSQNQLLILTLPRQLNMLFPNGQNQHPPSYHLKLLHIQINLQSWICHNICTDSSKFIRDMQKFETT